MLTEEEGDGNSESNFGTPVYHIAFLHNKLGKRLEDRYVVDLAVLLKSHGHKVVIYTCQFNPNDCLDEVNPLTGVIPVVYSAWWLPGCLKSWRPLFMAFRIALFPGITKPKFVFLNVHPIASLILYKFTKYKLFYVEPFSGLKQADYYSDEMAIRSTLWRAKCLHYTDAIITQSTCLGDVFRRSFPRVQTTIRYINPLIDIGLWTQTPLDPRRIIPDLANDATLLVTFGDYVQRANLRLALEAFEELLLLLDNDLKHKVHMVVAGTCSERAFEQKYYYNELTESAKEKYFASQITFLRQLPTIHKRTLIERSVGVIYPAKHDPYPEVIIAAMCYKRPIITTNTGFARTVLTHRISALLVPSSPNMFAAAMYKIVMNPPIERFISDMAHEIYRTQFAATVMYRKLQNLFESVDVEQLDALKDE